MKRLFPFFICLSLILSFTPITAAAAVPWPTGVSIEADGGILMDADTGSILYGKNENQAYYPASITKILTAQIDAFSKLKFEAEFQKLSPGGAVSYVEVPNMQNNIPAVLSVMKFIYNNIMYAELNTKSDYCECCGYDGEMAIKEDESGKLIWECPNCGNQDQNHMFVARRTCGYIGTQFWNQGRTQEIRDRVLHL